MANVNFPAGLRPIGNPSGTAPQITEYTRTSTAVIGEGALVYAADAGPVVWTGTATGGGLLLGALAHYASASDLKLSIYDDPRQEFLIQGDDAISSELTAIGECFGVIDSTTHNTTTLQSAMQMDVSDQTSVATTVLPLQVTRFLHSEDNDIDAADAKWIVKIAAVGHRFGD